MWSLRDYPASWVGAALLPVMLFTLYPVGQALWTSFHQVTLLFPVEGWAGLENYQRVVRSNYFLTALTNTLKFILVTAPTVVTLGTLIALLLRRRFFGHVVVRSVVLLPWVLPGAISAVLWIWVFNLGLIDRSIPWLTDPDLAFVAVSVAHIWTQIPFSVVLVMAALSTINSELIDAARVDGANAVRRFVYIVFPQIKAMIVVLVVYNSLTAMTSYDLVYAMTGGGPGTATTLLSFQIWRESFSMYDFGAGAAVAFIVVALSAVLITAILRALPSDLFAEEGA